MLIHQNIIVVNFHKNLLAKAVWDYKTKLYTNKTMKLELAIFT